MERRMSPGDSRQDCGLDGVVADAFGQKVGRRTRPQKRGDLCQLPADQHRQRLFEPLVTCLDLDFDIAGIR